MIDLETIGYFLFMEQQDKARAEQQREEEEAQGLQADDKEE